MNSEQARKHSGARSPLILLTAAVMILFPVLGAGENKKNQPPPPRPAAPPAQRPQARPSNNRVAPANNRVAQPNNRVAQPNNRVAPNNNRPVTPNRPIVSTNPQVNQGRNARTVSPTGTVTNRTAVRPGTNVSSRPAATKTVFLKSGGSANVGANGRLRSIDHNGAHIEYTSRGSRTITSMHNGARVVTTGAHQGYVQRPYVARNGHSYVQRTYVVNHVSRTVAYRSYYFHGSYYYGYAHGFYYRPAFYGWAYNPWPRPIYWAWGWNAGAYPWYGSYGYYFSPYPAYPSAAYWLTDYLIASNLQAAYAAGAAGAASAAGANNYANPPEQGSDAAPPAGDTASTQQQPTSLTPEVKQAIAEEVKAELAEEQTASNPGTSGAVAQSMPSDNDVPPALNPAMRTFVVASSLDVVANDAECTLTPGDVITRLTDTPDQDQKVTASVSSSKKADCAAGKQVLVAVQDLQEMQNHFREQLDSGLKELASKQGTGGLPRAPGTTMVAGEVPPPVVDATAAQSLQDQEATADQAEKDAQQQAPGQGGGF